MGRGAPCIRVGGGRGTQGLPASPCAHLPWIREAIHGSCSRLGMVVLCSVVLCSATAWGRLRLFLETEILRPGEGHARCSPLIPQTPPLPLPPSSLSMPPSQVKAKWLPKVGPPLSSLLPVAWLSRLPPWHAPPASQHVQPCTV